MSERRRPRRAFRPHTDRLEKLAGASTLALGVLTPAVLAALDAQPSTLPIAMGPGSTRGGATASPPSGSGWTLGLSDVRPSPPRPGSRGVPAPARPFPPRARRPPCPRPGPG
jgi:hypothetical protein